MFSWSYDYGWVRLMLVSENDQASVKVGLRVNEFNVQFND